jgi:hypothetical protein
MFKKKYLPYESLQKMWLVVVRFGNLLDDIQVLVKDSCSTASRRGIVPDYTPTNNKKINHSISPLFMINLRSQFFKTPKEMSNNY